jgi:POLQ-like helicase
MATKQVSEWQYPRFREYRSRKNAVAAAYFKQKGEAVSDRYPYILATRDDWRRNMVREDVGALIDQIQAERRAASKPFPLHKYIHHGLSSQAMLFNLLGPLVTGNRLDAIVPALESAGIPVPAGPLTAEFEVEDRSIFEERNQAQPTSIDVILSGADGASLFVEAKFVEQSFGGCSLFETGDCEGANPCSDLGRCYLHSIGRTYWQKMEKHGFLAGPVASSPICVLAPYYQFFREVLFALERGGHFVLLCDADNPVFLRQGPNGARGFFPFLKDLVSSEHQGKVHLLTIQTICTAIEDSGAGDSWLAVFRQKYGINAPHGETAS